MSHRVNTHATRLVRRRRANLACTAFAAMIAAAGLGPIRAARVAPTGHDHAAGPPQDGGTASRSRGERDALADQETDGTTRKWTDAARLEALRRAEVWQPPPVPIERAVFAAAPPATADPLECRFVPRVPGGTTAKFDCTLEDGGVIRVKYGTGPERHGEVAATRLARVVGFGADDVRFVPRLRCHGCPPAPFVTMKAAGALRAGDLVERAIDYGRSTDFEWVTVERRFPGTAIETSQAEGWGWYELEEVRRRADATRRTHIDALHLFAVFLAHWDNKAENQRLVCLEAIRPGPTCPRPFALVQDLGATFGPGKVDLAGWRDAVIWSDRGTCRVDMESLPFGGGTFRPLQVSEAGRQWLARRLAKLSDGQIRALFEEARFQYRDPLLGQPEPLEEWVRVFKERVQKLAEGPACAS